MLAQSDVEVLPASEFSDGPCGSGGARAGWAGAGGSPPPNVAAKSPVGRPVELTNEPWGGALKNAVHRVATCPGWSHLSQTCFPHLRSADTVAVADVVAAAAAKSAGAAAAAVVESAVVAAAVAVGNYIAVGCVGAAAAAGIENTVAAG